MRYRYRMVVCMAIGLLFGCGSEEAYVGDSSTLFTKIPALHSGIDFSNDLAHYAPDRNLSNFDHYYNGGGVAVGDVNGDGLQDLYFTANEKENKLYLNKGNLKFEDITSSAGVGAAGIWSNGATMADVNGDGLTDIYVSIGGNSPQAAKRRNQLFINNGDMTFTESAAEYGLDDAAFTTQAAFYDYDNDGDLDCFLLNHHVMNIDSREDQLKKQDDLSQADPLVGDKLYQNDNGKFTNVTTQTGIVPSTLGYGWGLGIGDLNSDGYTDLYVSNDYVERDFLYLYSPVSYGYQEVLLKTAKHISRFSMGNDIADINGDGHMDFFTVDMAPEDNFRQKVNMAAMNPKLFWETVINKRHYQYMYNSLQLNNGNATFGDIAQMAGVASTDWSWSPLFADYDNDGLQDLFVTNGYRKSAPS